MIVLSNISIGHCQDNQHSSTGGLDSIVQVHIDFIRAANAKFIELEYTKKANIILNDIIYNDSIIISEQNNTIHSLTVINEEEKRKYKNQRNIAIGAAGSIAVLFVLSLLK